MTLIGKMILIGSGGITSTTGITLLVVNKDKLFETSITQSIKNDFQEKDKSVSQLQKPIEKTVEIGNEPTNNPSTQTNEKNTEKDEVKTPENNPVDTPSVDSVQNDDSEDRSPKGKDYICRFDGTYDQENNKKKIKDFLENSKWNTKIDGIQILGGGKDDFTCAKDMNDNDLAGVFEYLENNKEIESMLSSVGGRPKVDNVIALRKKEESWTIFGENNEGGFGRSIGTHKE